MHPISSNDAAPTCPRKGGTWRQGLTGRATQASLSVLEAITRIDEVNLVENLVATLPLSRQLTLDFKPFEIRTFKFYLT